MREKDRMEKDVSNSLLLSVNQLMSNGTVLETREQLEQSIFTDTYKRAENIVKEIIQDNYNWRKNTNQEFSSSNVISFIGRRGTGKTSAMCSFAQELKDANNDSMLSKFESQDIIGKAGFHVLERIDASTLEASEDMFLLILANMFAKLLDREKQKSGMIQGYENRVLFEKFEGIFENFKALDQHTDQSGYSVFEQLKNMASSQRIREDFKSLVDLYLNEMTESDGKRRDYYLVVLIDDLDMAKQKKEQASWNWGSYKIMNSIYKYLTVPRVIVLTAYNVENLYSQCTSYYKNQYEEGFAKYESLASQFMEKVFPIYTRLYLPSWKKADLDTSEKIRINLDGYEDEQMIRIQEKQKEHLSIRQFIMILLSERTGIYFWNLNKETHFLEPDTLRTLFNMAVLLRGLKPYIAEKKDRVVDNKEELFDNLLFNLNVLKKDCLFRFANDQLSNRISDNFVFEDPKFAVRSEYEKFHEWLSLPIVVRSKQIVNWVSLQIDSLDNLGKGQHNERENKVIDPYSYAQLIVCIYAMKHGLIKISPQFGDCILYSYTLYMTELYEKYLYYKRKVTKEEYIALNRTLGRAELPAAESEVINVTKAKQYYSILKDIIGKGICGKWTRYYFSKLRFYLDNEVKGEKYRKEKGEKYRIGYVEKIRHEFSVGFDLNDMENTADLVDCVKGFLFVAMMHTNVMEWNYDDFSAKWIKKEETDKIDKLQLSFTFSNEKDDFDMTMPFFYQFCYAEFLDKMESEIQACLNFLPNQKENEGILDQIRENVRTAFDTIWSEYYNWDQEYGNMVLPVYNLDVMYNMMRSLYQEHKDDEAIEVMWWDCDMVILPEYLKMLDHFGQYLNDNNEKFGLDAGEGYAAAFFNSPVYDMVDKLNRIEIGFQEKMTKKMELKQIISLYIMGMVEYKASDKEEQKAPD